MKTNVKKIGICLMLLLCVEKGFGQIGCCDQYIEHLHAIDFNLSKYSIMSPATCSWDFVVGNYTYQIGTPHPYHYHYFAEDVFSSRQDKRYYFYYYFDCPPSRQMVAIPYWPNMDSFCGNPLGAAELCINKIRGPLYIDDIVFVDKNTIREKEGEYACSDEYDIKIKFKKPSELYYYDYFHIQNYVIDPVAFIECRNEGGEWVRIYDKGQQFKSDLIIEYSDFLDLDGLDPHEKMFFRTACRVEQNYATSTYTDKGFNFFPKFELPAGTKIDVIPPACKGDPTTIKIPYEDATNYNFTIKGTSGDWANGYNYAWGNPDSHTEVKKTATHYIITDVFPAGKDSLIIEYQGWGGKSPCAFKTTFNVPNILEFGISGPSYPDGEINGYKIQTIGNTARVQFTVSNSRSQSIRVYVGSTFYDITLPSTPTSVEDEINYYGGTVTLNLKKGEYNNIYAIAAGCSTKAVSAILNEPPPIAIQKIETTQPSCAVQPNLLGSNNTNNGTIILSNISGGIGSYKYKISTETTEYTINGNGATINGLSARTYSVTVLDAVGNSTTFNNITIQARNPIMINNTTSDPPSLWCLSDGKITISASGGSGVLKYSKENINSQFITGNALSGYPVGPGTFYIKDTCDCVIKGNAEVISPQVLSVIKKDTIPPTCPDGEDGKCVLQFTNRKGNLTVTLIYPFVSRDSIFIDRDIITIKGLSPDNYTCTITETLLDDNNKKCNFNVSFKIPNKNTILIDTIVTPVSNKGTATGEIKVNVSGGNGAPFTFSLSDDSKTYPETLPGNGIFSGLPGEFANGGKLYKLTVTDSKNCPKEIDVRILEPAETLRLQANITKPVSCHDDKDATISILATGGWGDYQYSIDSTTWNNTTTFNNLQADDYLFYVKDKNGGTAKTTITLVNPDPLDITVKSTTDAVCFGSATGSVSFLVSGGTPPYSLTPALGTVTITTENEETYMTVSKLPAAEYTFTLKDKHNCELPASKVTIGQPAKLVVSTSDLVQPTCGWSNGSLTVTASGGIDPYIYTLKVTETNAIVQTQTSSTAVQFENIAGGNYYITVTDKNGCTEQSIPLVFNQYTSPAINSVVVNDVICFGENNGKITATAKKGTNNIDYFTLTKKSDNTTIEEVTGIFENLFAGDYILYVFDTNGCQSQNAYPVVVKQPDALRIEVDTIIPVINKGTNDGKLQFRIIGGNTGNAVVYLKDDKNTKIDSISAIRGFTNELFVKAGTYTLEVTDCKDCYFTTKVFQVNEPADSLRLIIREVQDALCKSQTGKIVVEGQGGWGDYRYKRASGAQYTTLSRFENLYPGTYFITVIDKMGATASQSITVYEPQDSLKAEIVHIQTPTCAGNGALSIALSGGTLPYKLFSENGNDTIFADVPETVQWRNVASGPLLLHLTDANGCRFELETVVTDTALLRIDGFETIPPDVPRGANGSIRAKVSGGEIPLTYTWKKIGSAVSFPNNSQINNLSSGYYELKVTDANSCSVTNSVYLPDPSDETMTVVETGDETAVDAANGYAILYYEMDLTSIRIINPKNSYVDYPATINNADFHLSNDSIYLNNLAGGKWFIIGTNATGQNAIAGFEIKPYEAFAFGKIKIIHASTPNGSDGSISIEIQGGAGGNTFVWTDEQGNIMSSNSDEYTTWLSNLPAGKYTLTVTDKYGNTISIEIEVLAPEQALQLTALEQENQSCNGTVDAYVILSATGGWGDYRYAHYRQPGNNHLEYNNVEVYSELETGEHYFYVVDKYGTTAQLDITVIEPDLLRASVANIKNVRCKDEVNGQITFDISGGNPPYYFKEQRSTIWQRGNVVVNLSVGEYTFEFTDSLQCTSPDILTVIVTEPDSLLFQSIDVTHTTCNEDNGQILVSLKGGTRPYTYQWKDSEDNIIGTDSIVAGLKQNALYRLYVTDENGCTQYFEQLIQPSKLPRIISVETTNVLCYSDSTGAAVVTAVEAGEPYSPYIFTWSNGTTGESTGNLPAGRHSVTISDENYCATTYYFDITQPDSLYLLITGYKEPHCFGYSDGYIRSQAFGGAGDYTYLWSTGAATSGIDSIPTGNYWVRVTDANGCVFEKQFMLDEPAYQHIDLGGDIMMCPGNTHVIDGGNYVSYRWFTDKGDISRERYLSVTKEDRYFLETKTPDGCSAWGDIGVTIGNNALQADMLLPSMAAVGDTLVVFELSNLPLDSLKWEYDTKVFEQLSIKDEYYNLPYVLHLRCLQTGVYNIGLSAYSGGCYAPVVKQIEIVEAGDKDDDDWWGREPLIQSLKQYPNPTDGIFTVELELREAAEARFIIFEVSSGICVNQRTEAGSDYYNVSYNLTHLQTGVYVLIVTAGNERRQIKIVIE